MDFTIKRCGRAKYQEFLDMINTAFDTESNNEKFEEFLPNCTPYEKDATDGEIEKNFIALYQGKVIGAVGAYPFDWMVSDGGKFFNIKAFGIGQVSCLEKYRNNGVMSALMKHVHSETINDGYHISFLGGDRLRYSHFGYDFGGNTVDFVFEKNRFFKLCEPQFLDLNLRTAQTADYNELNSLYEQLPSYIKRNELAWKRHLERFNLEFIIGESENKKGYICIKNGKNCVEVAGDGGVILSLINTHLQKNGFYKVNVRYPYAYDGLSLALYNASASVKLLPYGLLAVHNSTALFDIFSETIEKQSQKSTKGLDPAQKQALINRLFGYAYQPLPQNIAGFEGVRPVCAWVPIIDDI